MLYVFHFRLFRRGCAARQENASVSLRSARANVKLAASCGLLTAILISGCVDQTNPVTESTSDDPSPAALTITPPADKQAEASGQMTAVDLGVATATGGDGNYSFSNDAPANGFPLGTASVTWTVTDGAGNQDTGTQSVTLSDTTPPTISAPADLQVVSTGATTPVDIGTANAIDLVDPNPSLSNDAPPNGYPVGVTIVTWTASDSSGNEASVAQTITVVAEQPTDPLSLSAPAPIAAEATAPNTVVNLGAAMANGGVPPISVTNDAPAGGFPVGSTTVTWTAEDANTTTVTATQVVTITDTTPPSITAPPDVVADQDAGGGNTSVNLGVPIVNDLADPNPVVSNDAPADGFPVGETMVAWTATDASGNSASDNQRVTINSSFSITAPSDISTEATGPTTAVALGSAMTSGGVPPVTISNDAPAGDFPVGVTTVTWTATDSTNASVSATQIVTISDTTAPSITAPADVVADQNAGGGNTNVNLGTPTVSDVADPNPSVSNDAPANGFAVGETTVVWTATDASGNSATDSQLVTINPPAGSIFPLSIDAAARILVDQQGDPFYINGEAAWSLAVQLNQAEIDTYLTDRNAKGVNAIYVNLIEHKYSSQIPAYNNAAGNAPFTSMLPGNVLDFTAPNDVYWQHVDYMFQRAEELGILVIAFPAYIGFQFNDSGWSEELQANSAANVRAYGDWLGQRYANQPNIMWAMGGDWRSDYQGLNLTSKVNALADGIESSGNTGLITAHSNRGRSALDDYNQAWLDINSTYSDCVSTPSRLKIDYQRSAMPFFYIEGRYENERNTTLRCIHSQAYWSILGGAFGHFYGNNPIWPFEAADSFADDPSLTWQEGLDLEGAQDLQHVAALLNARFIRTFEPDYGQNVLISGFGNINGATYAATLRAIDGSIVLAYIPAQRSVTIDMTSVSGATAKAWWFNPSTGQSVVEAEYATTGTRSFISPTAGDSILVLEDASLGLPLP